MTSRRRRGWTRISSTSPVHDPATDRATLAGHAYATDRDPVARQSLYQYQQPQHDLPGLVARELARTNGLVVDVGCGNGVFPRRLRTARPELRLIGLDISPGIMASVAGPRAVADAQRLPIPDRHADAVLAMHMLYHVPDIDAAIDEADRILAPGGVLVASTNSATDKAELDRLWARAASDVLGTPDPPTRVPVGTLRLGRRTCQAGSVLPACPRHHAARDDHRHRPRSGRGPPDVLSSLGRSVRRTFQSHSAARRADCRPGHRRDGRVPHQLPERHPDRPALTRPALRTV